MSQLPDKLFLRWGEVVTYLTGIGFTRRTVLKLKSSGVIEPKRFPGQVRAYYEAKEIAKIRPE